MGPVVGPRAQPMAVLVVVVVVLVLVLVLLVLVAVADPAGPSRRRFLLRIRFRRPSPPRRRPWHPRRLLGSALHLCSLRMNI